ncbi:MAG: hypothetical protein IH594_16755, partial [Bacteroidales bacterium]|nr:hypothetical protein [Bacteroidales bacterium]
MMGKAINLGNTQTQSAMDQVHGEFVDISGELFYKIHNYHMMPDFFISIVSDSDYWMYISSNGSLTAGRKDRDNVLFPYYTEDKIHDYQGITGSVSCFLVERKGKTFLWEPFTAESRKVYRVTRNICKSIYGNKIIFEEINSDLELSFQYGWSNSEKFGFVKKSSLTNLSTSPAGVDMLDGLRNIMPHGVDYAFQNEFSNLLDAYKKNERVEHTTLGLFMLSSIPADRPEPSEALRTTTVWSLGPLENPKILISDRQLDAFKNGLPVETENDIRAHRGAYFINSRLELDGHSSAHWMTVAQINQDSSDVADLKHFLKSEKNIPGIINKNIELGTLNLEGIVAKADGLQLSNEKLNSARHFSNTLFNVMRGGVYIRDYQISTRDFKRFVQQTNAPLFNSFENLLTQLPEETGYPELLKLAENSGSRDLLRIAIEYLPLTFSRRHGDPSRPWNRFSIDTRNPDGSVRINYEGNWRDIFQNWEALNLSFPEYTESIICKFLNASTADGYNPYRITRKGVDWECPDPNEPWAHIGYWGDHQVIYLQKFLEQSHAFHPGKLEELFTREIFVYANVPYRIKPFDEIVRDPKETIDFDPSLNREIEALVEQTGADGRLLRGAGGQLYYVSLAEKILVTTLTKLSNFIPEAGIWLNT